MGDRKCPMYRWQSSVGLRLRQPFLMMRKVIIMDEPTAALTENEVDQLYRIIETV